MERLLEQKSFQPFRAIFQGAGVRHNEGPFGYDTPSETDKLPPMIKEHESFMRLALEEAGAAGAEGEVPVGAVLVLNGEVLARDHNRREQMADPTAHAEILVLRKAGEALGHWRILNADLYVTLEPCAMCAGAMIHARIAKCIYGTRDPKTGAVESLMFLLNDSRLNHQVEVISGVLERECGEVIRSFFRERR